nr:immunoglobulin heavy chain junction region [Mus musculus]MBK4189713.1 immunoglobulin heavy chain junction region [Mus musculus]MBK4189714.1 immunoglobulin heavy chain junction region [Mus musculus]
CAREELVYWYFDVW